MGENKANRAHSVKDRMVRVTIPFLTVFFLLPQTALATNGLDLIGCGAESVAMSGAGNISPNLSAVVFDARDGLSVLYHTAQVMPGVAGPANDRFSHSAGTGIVYADIRQNCFPGTTFFNATDPVHFSYDELSPIGEMGK